MHMGKIRRLRHTPFSRENSHHSRLLTIMPSKPNPLTHGKKQKVQHLLQQHRLDEARPLLEQICSMDQRDGEAWYLLAAVNQHLGNLDAAIAGYRQVIALQPRHADALYYLGNALRDQGHPDDAGQCYRRVIAVKPDHLEAHCNLGTIYEQDKNHAAAIECYRQALRLDPQRAELHFNLGNALQELGQLEEAARCYHRAIELRPDYAEAYNNLGNTLRKVAEQPEAYACYQRAIQLKPDYFEAHINLGKVLKQQGLLGEALACFQQALRIKPDSSEGLYNVAGILAHQGRLDEAIDCYLHIRNVDTENVIATSKWFFYLNYSPRYDASAIFAEHRRWAAQYDNAPRPTSYANAPAPGRRLRIGYVSPDFRTHSVAFFIDAVLRHHDPAQFDVVCYANVENPDATTKHLQQLVPQWRDISATNDQELQKIVRDDAVDILVDLAGHTDGNRLPIFTHRPAPVQVTYLGYANTTGLTAMDYRITDAWADPPGQEAFHTEALVRLPRGFLCYTPRPDAPAIAPLPAREAGHITFGSFNAMPKITTEVIELWARILRALPTAQLFLKNSALRDRTTRKRCLALFEQQGVLAGRVELMEIVPATVDHLALYNRIDIALDTCPYNGTTTTCEAMWMGVPVIVLEGNRHAARVGVSLINQVGLTELIAKTPEKYVQIAVNLAQDTDKLANLRAGLRQRMAGSPLCDGAGFTRDLEQAYREMWRKWCAETAGTASST